jgi:hypothetical protein
MEEEETQRILKLTASKAWMMGYEFGGDFKYKFLPITEAFWNTRQYVDAIYNNDVEVQRYYAHCPDF